MKNLYPPFCINWLIYLFLLKFDMNIFILICIGPLPSASNSCQVKSDNYVNWSSGKTISCKFSTGVTFWAHPTEGYDINQSCIAHFASRAECPADHNSDLTDGATMATGTGPADGIMTEWLLKSRDLNGESNAEASGCARKSRSKLVWYP